MVNGLMYTDISSASFCCLITNRSLDDVAPVLLPFVTTNASDQLQVSVHPENKAMVRRPWWLSRVVVLCCIVVHGIWVIVLLFCGLLYMGFWVVVCGLWLLLCGCRFWFFAYGFVLWFVVVVIEF